MKSMAFQCVGRIHIVVITSELPTDDEWDDYLQAAHQSVATLQGTCVLTYGGMPTASQRNRTAKSWLSTRERPPTAVLSASVFSRTIVNATQWLIGDKIKAFALSEQDEAFAYLRMDANQRASATETIDYFRRLLRVAS